MAATKITHGGLVNVVAVVLPQDSSSRSTVATREVFYNRARHGHWRQLWSMVCCNSYSQASRDALSLARKVCSALKALQAVDLLVLESPWIGVVSRHLFVMMVPSSSLEAPVLLGATMKNPSMRRYSLVELIFFGVLNVFA